MLSGILSVMGGRGQENRNFRRMATNKQVEKVCMEEGVGFVDRLNFVEYKYTSKEMFTNYFRK